MPVGKSGGTTHRLDALEACRRYARWTQAGYRIVALEDALMPFAAMADEFDENVADGDTINP